MDAEQLRQWLLRMPRPTRLSIVDVNGEPHELDIRKGATWKAVAESVMAIDAESIQAFEGDKYVRGTKVAELEPEPAEEAAPGIDGTSQQLIVFGKLLAAAYEHSNKVAFETLSDICRSMTERTQALEGALRSTEQIMNKMFQDAVVAQAKADVAAAGEGDGDDVLGTRVKGLVVQAAQTPAPKPNGGHS
jgi:hypothetical protein